MKEFTLRKYGFGDFLGIVGDTAHWNLAHARQRFDADGDMPKLLEACGVTTGHVVVDAGAFIGDTAWALAATGASIIAFEPFLDAFTAMLYNTRGIESPPVRAFNRPTGNGEWVRLISECPGSNFGMRSVKSVPTPPGFPDSVQTMKIDELELQSCKLIKADVEGFEIPTLLGARETIKRCRPFLYCEMYEDGMRQHGYTRKELVDCIFSLGYHMEVWGAEPRFDWFCTPR